jgi:hypothetical protein
MKGSFYLVCLDQDATQQHGTKGKISCAATNRTSPVVNQIAAVALV